MANLLLLLERLWTFAVLLATVALFVGFPLWLAYLFVSPFFGADPMGHLASILKHVGSLVLFAGTATLFLVVGMRAYGRWRPVRVVARFVGYAIVGLIVLGSLSRCLDGQDECVPSRYIEC